MPLWRYASNRLLTLIQNFVIGEKLSEYHTGYRAYSRELLEMIDLDANSNDFIFDNQILMQILWHHFRIGEISCPAKYQPESSSINFRRSVVYGLGCLLNSLHYRLAKTLRLHSKRFPAWSGSTHYCNIFLTLWFMHDRGTLTSSDDYSITQGTQTCKSPIAFWKQSGFSIVKYLQMCISPEPVTEWIKVHISSIVVLCLRRPRNRLIQLGIWVEMHDA